MGHLPHTGASHQRVDHLPLPPTGGNLLMIVMSGDNSLQ